MCLGLLIFVNKNTFYRYLHERYLLKTSNDGDRTKEDNFFKMRKTETKEFKEQIIKNNKKMKTKAHPFTGTHSI